MLRSITLHGPLAKQFDINGLKLDVDGLHSLLQGLNCARKGFLRTLKRQRDIALVLKDGDRTRVIDKDTLGFGFGDYPEVHLATSEHGSMETAAAWVVETIYGMSSASAYYAAAVAVTTVALSVIASAVISSIAQSMADQPKNERASAENPSALFDGAVNLQGQGHPIPLVYGRFRVGSVTISADVATDKNAIAIGDSTTLQAGDTATGNLLSNDIDGTTLTISSFTVGGSSYAAGATHTASDYTITVASNGDYTITSMVTVYSTNVDATYTATSSTSETTSKWAIQINPTYNGYIESTGG